MLMLWSQLACLTRLRAKHNCDAKSNKIKKKTDDEAVLEPVVDTVDETDDEMEDVAVVDTDEV